MKFNINNYVKVKLTDHGKEILLKQAEEFRSEHPNIASYYELPKEDDEGFSKWQLHSLMYRLGHLMFICGENVIETEIEIIENQK